MPASFSTPRHATVPAASVPDGIQPPPRILHRYGVVLTDGNGRKQPLLLTEVAKAQHGRQRRKIPQVERNPDDQDVERDIYAYLKRSFGLDITMAEIVGVIEEIDIVELPWEAVEHKKADEIHIIWVHVRLLVPHKGLNQSALHQWLMPSELFEYAQSYRLAGYQRVLITFEVLKPLSH